MAYHFLEHPIHGPAVIPTAAYNLIMNFWILWL
jgi:hypothetical protein